MKTKLFILSLTLLMQTSYAQWQESDQVLRGKVVDGFFGFEIAMSDNGQVLAVSDPLRFITTRPNPITLYNRVNDAWVETGQIENSGDSSIDFGFSMDFSDDGTILAYSVLIAGDTTGFVRVLQNNNGVWEQVGADIPNASSINSTRFGDSVSINGDGTVLAISAPVVEQPTEGEVFVYRNVNDNWIQIGDNLGGDPETDLFFGQDLSLNDDGTLLAVGVLEGAQENGRVEFYQINETTIDELKSPIFGDVEGSDFGSSVEFNAAGDRIIIGASNPNNSFSYAEVYENVNEQWIQLGQRLADELNNLFREFGTDVDINGAGNRIVVSDSAFDSADLSDIDLGAVYFYSLDNSNNWNLISRLTGELGVEEVGGSIAMDDVGLIVTAGAIGIGDINDSFVGGVRTYTNDDVLSTEDTILANGVKLFPNPFQNEFTIEFSNLDLNYSYRVIDTYGRTIIKNDNIQTSSLHKVNLNQVPSGAYFIEIVQENNAKTSLKLIKQ